MTPPPLDGDGEQRSIDVITLTISTIILEVAIVLLLVTAARVSNLDTYLLTPLHGPIDDAALLLLLSTGLTLVLIHLRSKIRHHRRR